MAGIERLLLVNANTSEALTERLVGDVRAMAPGLAVEGRTGRFGARIITTRTELAVAEHALIDALTTPAMAADAVIIAVSFDVGLRAAAEIVAVPVYGITQAALEVAASRCKLIGLATFGARCTGIYRQLVAGYGLERHVVGYRPVELPPAGVYADPRTADAAVADAAQLLVVECGAEIVVVTGAAMAGVPARIAGAVAVPVLDGLTCALQLARSGVRLRRN